MADDKGKQPNGKKPGQQAQQSREAIDFEIIGKDPTKLTLRIKTRKGNKGLAVKNVKLYLGNDETADAFDIQLTKGTTPDAPVTISTNNRGWGSVTVNLSGAPFTHICAREDVDNVTSKALEIPKAPPAPAGTVSVATSKKSRVTVTGKTAISGGNPWFLLTIKTANAAGDQNPEEVEISCGAKFVMQAADGTPITRVPPTPPATQEKFAVASWKFTPAAGIETIRLKFFRVNETQLTVLHPNDQPVILDLKYS